ncbi:MAG: iron chelate uptake ABC transporter family permease subunit [Chloroflexota bacterium]|nr:metal ABC transporter permease [Dehalococcoidia bacterium]MDW8254065.1 iron chelate uptake ABC transporter family permease subunit [Chloroflexota bacterium]
MTAVLTDYTLRNVILGAALLGAVSGVLGTFAVLRRQGLLGDVLAHAALPGICLAFLLSGSKAMGVLLFGAGITAWVGALLLLWMVRRTKLGEDAALGIVLAVFFGIGLTLLTAASRRPDATQAGLDRYLFGQAAALVTDHVVTMAILAAAALVTTALLFKELKLLAFDPEFLASLGFGVGRLNVLLTTLIVIAIVIGLQTVGVVLMAAMLVGPAVAARHWTNRLGRMIALSAVFGVAAGVAGALVSASGSRIPTGPVIVLALTGIVVLSILFGPARGVVPHWWRAQRARAEGGP